MLEKVPGKPDPKVLVDFFIPGLREEEKTYGPVFTVRVINHALQFISKKFGEKTPKDIRDLDQLTDYILSISDKHPTSYNAIIYSQFKTENEFQGQTGAGTRVAVMGTTRSKVKKPSVKERDVDIYDAISKFRKFTIDLKIAAHKLGYKKNEDGSVDLLWSTCFIVDGCQFASEDGLLKRPDLRMQCIVGTFLCQFLKTVTSYEWDYDVLESYKPHCVTRCYMI